MNLLSMRTMKLCFLSLLWKWINYKCPWYMWISSDYGLIYFSTPEITECASVSAVLLLGEGVGGSKLLSLLIRKEGFCYFSLCGKFTTKFYMWCSCPMCFMLSAIRNLFINNGLWLESYSLFGQTTLHTMLHSENLLFIEKRNRVNIFVT